MGPFIDVNSSLQLIKEGALAAVSVKVLFSNMLYVCIQAVVADRLQLVFHLSMLVFDTAQLTRPASILSKCCGTSSC